MFIAIALGVLAACSTKKNTSMTRSVQAFKARYNTYFNGNESFKEGRLQQEEGNKDNFTEIIPLYATGNKNTVKIGSSNFETAITKCQKTIKTHTITKKPEWKSNRQKTPKDKIWLSQKEYNPFLWKAWFLMAEAQFRKGDYMEAATTYAYIQRLYFSKPNIIARARVLEARCYAEMEWFYDAEDLLQRAQRDSFPNTLEPLKAQVYADIQLRQKMYKEAIPNIEKSLKAETRGRQKTRLYFLLGQLHHKTGNDKEAFKYFKKVIKRNPSYDLEFNARIQLTEAMAKGHSKQMIRKLNAMAKNPKNKEYLDQVYYALGNIYLAKGDTTRAIWAYSDGVEKSSKNGIEKGVVLLHLGQLYWMREKFVDAQKCYSQALGLFDKDREDYKEIDERSKILDELLPSAEAVEVQDSLQMMAKLDSVTRMAKIKKTIEELKKKEKEEERKNAESSSSSTTSQRTNASSTIGPRTAANRNNREAALWYFYNPTTVAAGKKEFEKKWGKRELADDWQRKNKTVLSDFNDEQVNDSLSEEESAMILEEEEGGGKKDKAALKAEKDSLKQAEYEDDPHRPEFYLKDIPFTEEQMAASNAALVEGLYGSAVVYKDRMENFPLAERTFKRILVDFPEYEHMDETYYNMFQLYSRMDRRDDAEVYRQKLMEEFPENEHGLMIADPQFEYKGRYGKQIEDSIYTVTWEAFNAGEYQKVLDNSSFTEKEYPKGDNRPRFMFLEAMSQLEMGNTDNFMNKLKSIVEKYPKSSVSELAGLYVKGLKEGRLLSSGKFTGGSIWERRMRFGENGDSLNGDSTFSTEKICNYVFTIAYERDSIDENQLLFEIARYNFTTFAVRNFDMGVEKGDGIDMLQVRTFLNYDEAYIYMRRLLNDDEMAAKLKGLKCFIISEENLAKLKKGLSFMDYFNFFDENMEPGANMNGDGYPFDGPTDFKLQGEEDEEEEDEDYEEYDDDFLF
ncbi:MAG: tetratricopeptide repeat protein [Bacteroidaceae bacterium]|nr:tetratricopeptide repeat protein [Bacteroidaceae bacterium]